MKNLAKKFKEGARKALNKGKKALPYLAMGAGVVYLSAQDADAQVRSDYKDHDKGGKFKGYTPSSNGIFEEKVFYNPVTKNDERFYIQNLQENLYNGDLNIAAFSFDNTFPIMGFKTGDPSHLVSEEMYVFLPRKEDVLEIEESHVSDRSNF